jgi:hypothetical protein
MRDSVTTTHTGAETPTYFCNLVSVSRCLGVSLSTSASLSLNSGLLAVCIALIVAWPRPVQTHGSLTTTVLFDREIVRLLNDRCVMCHIDGGLAFPLETYEQTWLQGRAMRSSVLRRHMPPWSAVAGYGEFVNDNHLTLRESQFLVSWVEGLGPRNAGKVFLNVVDPRAAAPPEIRATIHTAQWQLGEPDLTRRLTPTTIEARSPDVVRRSVVDLDLASARQARALEFMPGDRRVVRAATFSLESTGQWLGSWTPWHTFVSLPDDVVYRLPAKARIVVDTHYRGASAPAVDASTLGVFFDAPRFSSSPEFRVPSPDSRVPSPGLKAATDLVVDARPLAGARVLKGTSRLASDTRVWAIQPEIVAGLSSLEVSARRPDGGTEVLLALTEPSVEWPTPYLLKTPRLLGRGTEVFVVARSSTGPLRQVRVRMSRY